MVVLGGIAAFAVIFLESGADTGNVRLDIPEAYAPGAAEYIGASNFYLVRLRDGSFLALSDLDAANHANQSHRCRVQLTPINAASLGVPVERLRGQASPQAAGANVVLTESCNGAIYDITGLRLDSPGRNLDLHPVSIGKDGHVMVNVRTRECSERTADSTVAMVDCQ